MVGFTLIVVKVELPDKESFNITSDVFCQIPCNLIVPKIDAEWNKNNLFFRSLIVDNDGNVLSSGWPKFFNYKEKEHCYPNIVDFRDLQCIEKIDGTLVICDYINNTFNLRTRGTVSYTTQQNSKDFELLTKKYPKIIDFLKNNDQFSLLFELVTPNNIIVVRPKEIEFYFIGAINKATLTVVSAEDLLNIWRKIGPISTPQITQFSVPNNIDDIFNYVRQWKGKEGLVISYNNNQNRIKLKTDWYCFIHKAKSQLNSIKNLIEMYVDLNQPEFEAFFKTIETEYDYELATQLVDDIRKVCEMGTKVKKYIFNINEMISDIRNVPTRKQQAEMIKRVYQKNSAFAFTVLDNKQFTKDQYIKLICQQFEQQ